MGGEKIIILLTRKYFRILKCFLLDIFTYFKQIFYLLLVCVTLEMKFSGHQDTKPPSLGLVITWEMDLKNGSK